MFYYHLTNALIERNLLTLGIRELLEMEYQKARSIHEIAIRPDIIFHIPAEVTREDRSKTTAQNGRSSSTATRTTRLKSLTNSTRYLSSSCTLSGFSLTFRRLMILWNCTEARLRIVSMAPPSSLMALPRM